MRPIKGGQIGNVGLSRPHLSTALTQAIPGRSKARRYRFLACSEHLPAVLALVVHTTWTMKHPAAQVSVEWANRFGDGLGASVIPGRNRLRVAPQSDPRRSRGHFSPSQLGIARVLLVVPGQTRLDEGQAEVLAFDRDASHRPTVTVNVTRLDADRLAKDLRRGELFARVLKSWASSGQSMP